MARLNHTTLATLRHYDKVGILSPVYVNPETGYRYAIMMFSSVWYFI